MLKKALIVALALAAQLAPGAALADEKKCGWIVNPTPGNWWLSDAKGEWMMSTQGGAQAEGMDLAPDLTVHDFVKTNGEYGYACGCIEGVFKDSGKEVKKIVAFAQKPLSVCKNDKSLKALD